MPSTHPIESPAITQARSDLLRMSLGRCYESSYIFLIARGWTLNNSSKGSHHSASLFIRVSLSLLSRRKEKEARFIRFLVTFLMQAHHGADVVPQETRERRSLYFRVSLCALVRLADVEGVGSSHSSGWPSWCCAGPGAARQACGGPPSTTWAHAPPHS